MTFLAFIAGLGLAAEIDFATLPHKVQVTINRNLDGGLVHEIRLEQTNGAPVYVVGVRNEGERRQLRVDPEGRLR